MQPDGRRLNPGGAKNFTDVNEGAESLHVLTQPQCVQEPEHASICSPTKTVLALIETIRHVRCDPAMHQPLEDLESARWVCDGLARQSELPKLRDHVPSEDQLKKKTEKISSLVVLRAHVATPRSSESVADKTNPTLETTSTGREENAIFQEIRPSKALPCYIANNSVHENKRRGCPP